MGGNVFRDMILQKTKSDGEESSPLLRKKPSTQAPTKGMLSMVTKVF